MGSRASRSSPARSARDAWSSSGSATRVCSFSVRVLTVGNMYPPHHLGGYELMWRSSVEHLRASGHEVTVLTTDYRNATPDPAIEEGADVHRELAVVLARS